MPDRKRAEDTLARQASDLARANEDLRQINQELNVNTPTKFVFEWTRYVGFVVHRQRDSRSRPGSARDAGRTARTVQGRCAPTNRTERQTRGRLS